MVRLHEYRILAHRHVLKRNAIIHCASHYPSLCRMLLHCNIRAPRCVNPVSWNPCRIYHKPGDNYPNTSSHVLWMQTQNSVSIGLDLYIQFQDLYLTQSDLSKPINTYSILDLYLLNRPIHDGHTEDSTTLFRWQRYAPPGSKHT